jgi:formylglycine-generating enzyme required for sulfatase activity
VRDVEVPPGSFVIELRAPGRPAIDVPVLLARDERFAVDVPLPASVPDGFAYVPAGRTVFGTSDAESVRAFFGAVPLHPVTTDAYLIARHETTFAEWIEFLEDLPEARSRSSTRPPGGSSTSPRWRIRCHG